MSGPSRSNPSEQHGPHDRSAAARTRTGPMPQHSAAVTNPVTWFTATKPVPSASPNAAGSAHLHGGELSIETPHPLQRRSHPARPPQVLLLRRRVSVSHRPLRGDRLTLCLLPKRVSATAM